MNLAHTSDVVDKQVITMPQAMDPRPLDDLAGMVRGQTPPQYQLYGGNTRQHEKTGKSYIRHSRMMASHSRKMEDKDFDTDELAYIHSAEEYLEIAQTLEIARSSFTSPLTGGKE